MRVFLSYRREDSSEVVERIAERLRVDLGLDKVFKDIDSIPDGDNFLEKIQHALTAADILLVVIGPGWMNALKRPGKRRLDDPDDWVRIEIHEALDRDDVRVVPLLVNGATMPRERDLPPGLKALAYRTARTLRPGPLFESDLDTLARRLAPSTGPSIPTKTEPRPEISEDWGMVPRKSRSRLRRSLVAASMIAAAVISIILLLPNLGDFNEKNVLVQKPAEVKPIQAKVEPKPKPETEATVAKPVEVKQNRAKDELGKPTPEPLVRRSETTVAKPEEKPSFETKRALAWRAIGVMIVAAEAAGLVKTSIDPPPILDILINGRADDLENLTATPNKGVSPEVFGAWWTGFGKTNNGIDRNKVLLVPPNSGLKQLYNNRSSLLKVNLTTEVEAAVRSDVLSKRANSAEEDFTRKRESAWRAIGVMIVAAEAAGLVKTSIDPPPILDILINGRADDLDALKAVTDNKSVAYVSPEVFCAWFAGSGKAMDGIAPGVNLKILGPNQGLAIYFRERATLLNRAIAEAKGQPDLQK